ncbi:MAG: WD40/YVTN/BNR-like repeat-containing protein [Bacteroidota bacterium]
MIKHIYSILLIVLATQVGAQDQMLATGVIHVTKDQGASWRQADAGLPADTRVNAFVETDGFIFAGTDNYGIYVTKANAIQWTPVNKGLPLNLGISSMIVFNHTLLAGSYKGGVYVSTDNGGHWQQSNTGLNEFSVRSLYVLNFVIYAGTNDGIYSSMDGGKKWVLEKRGAQVNAFTSVGSRLIAATNHGVILAQDNESDWTSVSVENGIRDLASDGNTLYALAYRQTLYKSTDGGMTWKPYTPPLAHTLSVQVIRLGNKFFAVRLHELLPLKMDATYTELFNSSVGLIKAPEDNC